MTIRKQEFYEGAALHLLTRDHGTVSLKHDGACFVLNERLAVYLKYSTKVRSPWGFTLAAAELKALQPYAARFEVYLGFICGGDGIAAVSLEDARSITDSEGGVAHVACHRSHNEHYEVKGPAGCLRRKVAPSDWCRILNVSMR